MPTTSTQKKPATKTSKKLAAGRLKASPAGAARPGRARAEALPGGMITSKVTARSQTTLPRGVRQVLDLQPGQRLGYVFDETGVRLVNPSAVAHEDPAIREFLGFLVRHMESDPASSMVPFPAELLSRARAVTEGIEIAHDAPIAGAISL
jgi:antitoxin PrlF